MAKKSKKKKKNIKQQKQIQQSIRRTNFCILSMSSTLLLLRAFLVIGRGLKLPANDMIILDVAYEYQLSEELLEEVIRYAKREKNDRTGSFYYQTDGMVAAFAVKEKLRIMYEIRLVSPKKALSCTNYNEYSKEELYHRAYHEPITEYYNWTWMGECLEKYYLEGIKDYAFVHFDVKEFKMINELYNHEVAIVDSYGVDRALIEFEITETIAYDNQAYMIAVLRDLKQKGFRISMDDFGTGYSSFALLKGMPLDTLKIDKSFVDLIEADEDTEKITIILRHIISMAKELGIDSIAEGVEEYTQVEALREWGVRNGTRLLLQQAGNHR